MPVLERSSSKLSLLLNLNMQQVRERALGCDFLIIRLGGRESFFYFFYAQISLVNRSTAVVT